MSSYKEEIKQILAGVSGVKNPEVEFSANEQFGDYSSNICLQNKDLNIDEIVKNLNKENSDFSAEKLGRFINFRIKNDILVDNLMHIDSKKEDYGKSDIGNGKLAIVEYSSPNIAKPFGVGHLRSTVIGDAIANLMQFSGYKVMRDNHLGDWGTQFGKVICAIKKWGNEEDIEKSDDPVGELVALYVKYHEASKIDPKLDDEARLWFKKIEDNDIEAKRLWQKCVDWSWVEFDKIYKLLGIKFDESFNKGRGLGESFFETRMNTVLSELEKKKMLKVGDEGAKLVFFDNLPPLMIIKKDGATLYATRDLATDKYRLEKYDPDLIINEVGSEQSLYFKQLFEIEKILGWYEEGQRVHVGHGLFMLDGKKMSTRAGKTVKLDEVLTEAIERAKKLGKKSDGSAYAEATADAVGVGAIKYFDLSHQPMTNINFDWDTMFAMDGNSSPYIQYTIARCNSVVAKGLTLKALSVKGQTLPELTEVELSVLSKLSQFQEIIVTAVKTYSPNILCNYLYELASKFNTFYNAEKIIGGDNEEFKLLLTKGTAQVLKNGLKLLGIESPEKM
ncbi:MAG: hypothetical protein ACD_19C00426G0027 [uncultured bacterium]|nr:MAG: hypothetical protein ACD_19C00426G0027 [uncultured bacterium]